MKMMAYWDIAPRSLVEADRRFRVAYCLHHQGDHRPCSMICVMRGYSQIRSKVLLFLFQDRTRKYIVK
jgi:hypothetical protein